MQDREGRIPRIGSPNITPSCCRTRRTGGPLAIAANSTERARHRRRSRWACETTKPPGEGYNAISRRNLAELRWSRTDAATIVSPDRITFYRGPCSAGSAQVVSCCGIAPSAPPRCSGATLNFRRALNLLTRSRDQRADFPDGEPTLSGGCCERSLSRPEAPTCGQARSTMPQYEGPRCERRHCPMRSFRVCDRVDRRPHNDFFPGFLETHCGRSLGRDRTWRFSTASPASARFLNLRPVSQSSPAD